MDTEPADVVTGRISTEDISSMGIETMLLAVQVNKALILEDLLAAQMMALQEKNDQVAALNNVMAYFNGELARFDKDATSTTRLTPPISVSELERVLFEADLKATTFFGKTEFENINKSQLDAAATKVKSLIDNLNNTQQLDMVRLQSLSSKRNEAYELMTTFIKKFSDLISSIIRNMG